MFYTESKPILLRTHKNPGNSKFINFIIFLKVVFRDLKNWNSCCPGWVSHLYLQNSHQLKEHSLQISLQMYYKSPEYYWIFIEIWIEILVVVGKLENFLSWYTTVWNIYHIQYVIKFSWMFSLLCWNICPLTTLSLFSFSIILLRLKIPAGWSADFIRVT